MYERSRIRRRHPGPDYATRQHHPVPAAKPRVPIWSRTARRRPGC